MPVKIENSFAPYTPVGDALNNAITAYTNSIPTYGEVQEGRVNANKADSPQALADSIRAMYGSTGAKDNPLTPQMVQDNLAGIAQAAGMGGNVGEIGNLLRTVVANSANPASVQMIDRAQQGAGQAYNTTETGTNNAEANDLKAVRIQQDGANYRAGIQAQNNARTTKQQMETEKLSKGKVAFQSILDDMQREYNALDENGGLVSNKSGVLENIRARIGASATGQMTGGFIGTENQTRRDNVTAKLPLLKQAVMAATGMSAKQMDSNVEMKAFMQALSDPSKSKETINQTIATLGRLYGAGGMAPAPTAAPTVDVSGEVVSSGQEAPDGLIYDDVTGKAYRLGDDGQYYEE